MRPFLLRLADFLRKPGRRRPLPRPPCRRASLRLEGLEDRLALSTTVPGLAAPLTAPALVAAPVLHDGTGITPPIGVSPEKCVHGYKWRPPRRYPYVVLHQAGTEATPMMQQANPVASLPFRDLHPPPHPTGPIAAIVPTI